jgi:hypothetical protein
MATVRDGIRAQITNSGELGTGVTVDNVDISGIKLNSMPTAADGDIDCNAQDLTNAGSLAVSSGNDGDGTIAVRSGNASQYSKISMGTDSNKATIGCPGAADTFFTGAAQGDLVIRADDNNNKVHIGAGTSGPAGMVVTEVSNVGRVGVGTSSPTVPLEIQDTTTSSASQGGNLRLSANDGAVMADGHRLGVLEFAGAEDTGGSITVGARIEALCDATWSASENGADLLFYTTDGNASQAEQMRILADGKIGIGVADPDAALEVLQGSGNQLKLSFDGTDNATFAVDTAGDLTIVPSGGDVLVTGTVKATSGIEVTGGNLSVTGGITTTTGIEITTNEADSVADVTASKSSGSNLGGATQTARKGVVSYTFSGSGDIDAGATVYSDIANATCDADSVVLACPTHAYIGLEVAAVGDSGFRIWVKNLNGGAPHTADFTINYVIL